MVENVVRCLGFAIVFILYGHLPLTSSQTNCTFNVPHNSGVEIYKPKDVTKENMVPGDFSFDVYYEAGATVSVPIGRVVFIKCFRDYVLIGDPSVSCRRTASGTAQWRETIPECSKQNQQKKLRLFYKKTFSVLSFGDMRVARPSSRQNWIPLQRSETWPVGLVRISRGYGTRQLPKLRLWLETIQFLFAQRVLVESKFQLRTWYKTRILMKKLKSPRSVVYRDRLVSSENKGRHKGPYTVSL